MTDGIKTSEYPMDPDKFFATDRDKFVFWVGDDGYIKFEKVGIIASKRAFFSEESEREFKDKLFALPKLEWDAFKSKDTN